MDSSSAAQPATRDWTSSAIWPWFVLALALAATLAATLRAQELMAERHAAAVQAAIEDETAKLQSRLGTYVALLRATRSFVIAEGAGLSAGSFRDFVAGIDVASNYPGIQGIGFSPRVFPRHAPGSSAAKWTFTIEYLEPLDERNRAALGYDMFSEPVRAEAMARARDTARPAMTGRVVLRQEIQPQKSAGFLLYVPYYGSGRDPGTVAERRADLLAFVYAPFRAPDFFGALGTAAGAARLHRVYAGPRVSQSDLLYESESAGAFDGGAAALRTIELYGSRWTLEFATRPQAAAATAEIAATAAAGLAISVLLFSLLRSLRRARLATEHSARADRRQRELTESLLGTERVARQAAEEQQTLLARQVQFAEMLMGIVSHDLRNPISVMMLNAEIFERAGLPPPLAGRAGRIKEAGRMALALIRDLLDFTQARLGPGIRVQRTQSDLARIVQDAVEELRLLNPQRVLVFEALGDCRGAWDIDRLTRVVFNLVNNAIVYGTADTPVTVRVTGRADAAVVEVHNRGEPIPAELLGRMFEPLHQGEHARCARAGNIGLGLYIVRQIVVAHGGQVAVESARAEGTTFRIELPRGETAADA